MDESLFQRTNKQNEQIDVHMESVWDNRLENRVSEMKRPMLEELQPGDYMQEQSRTADIMGTRKHMEAPVYENIRKSSPKQREARREDVGVAFSRIYSRIEKRDSRYMRSIKDGLRKYFDYEDILKYDAKHHNLTMEDRRLVYERSLELLEQVSKSCEVYRSQYWYKIFSKRKDQVRDVRVKAEEKLMEVKEQYVNFLDMARKKGTTFQETAEPEELEYTITKNGTLKFSEENLTVRSDRHLFASKNYLKIRTETDLQMGKKQDLFSQEQTDLLKELDAYAEIKCTAGIFRRKGGKQSLQKERKLATSIRRKLTDLLADEQVPSMVKERFRPYQDYLDSFWGGNLVMEANADVYDTTGENVQYYRSTQKSPGQGEKQKRGTVKDRSGEPLFAHEPCMSDVVQYKMGNCYLLAGIAQLVSTGGATIQNMMREDGDTVTVRFFQPKQDGSYKPVYVKVDKKVDPAASFDTLWVQVLCKAFAAFMGKCLGLDRNEIRGQVSSFHPEFYEDGVPQNVIDYGFICNGGSSDTILNLMIGGKYRSKRNLLGTFNKYYNDADVLRVGYRTQYRSESMQRRIKSGEIYKDDFAVYVYDSPKYSSGNAYYYKKAHQQAMTESDARMEQSFTDYDRCNGALGRYIDEKKLNYQTWNFVKDFLQEACKSMVGNDRGFLTLCKYSAGCRNLPKNELQDGEKLYSLFTVDYETKLLTRDFWKNHSKQNPKRVCNMLSKFPKDILLGELRSMGYSYRFEELTGMHFFEKNKFTDCIQPERREELKQRAKDRILSLTKKCIAVLERKARRKHYTEKRVYETVKDTDYETYMGLEAREEEKPLTTLAALLEKTPEEAYEMVRTAVQEKRKAYVETKQKRLHKKTSTIFSGFYTEEAMEIFQSIQSRLRVNEPVVIGSKITDKTEEIKQGVVGRHAYSIIGTKDIVFRGRTIHMLKVNNPWGYAGVDYRWDEKEKVMNTSMSTKAGVFYIELTHYMKTFADITE